MEGGRTGSPPVFLPSGGSVVLSTLLETTQIFKANGLKIAPSP